MYTQIVNVVNIVVGKSKQCSLRGDVVVSNNGFDQEDNLESMPSLIDDSQQAFPIQNVEQYNMFFLNIFQINF